MRKCRNREKNYALYKRERLKRKSSKSSEFTFIVWHKNRTPTHTQHTENEIPQSKISDDEFRYEMISSLLSMITTNAISSFFSKPALHNLYVAAIVVIQNIQTHITYYLIIFFIPLFSKWYIPFPFRRWWIPIEIRTFRWFQFARRAN